MKAILFISALFFSASSNAEMLNIIFGDYFNPANTNGTITCSESVCSAYNYALTGMESDEEYDNYSGDVGLFMWYQTPKSFTAEISWSGYEFDGAFRFNESLIPMPWETSPHNTFPDDPILFEEFSGSRSGTFQYEFQAYHLYSLSLGGQAFFGGSSSFWSITDLDYEVPVLPSEVPVPAALYLFAPALLGFMGLRRKIKSS